MKQMKIDFKRLCLGGVRIKTTIGTKGNVWARFVFLQGNRMAWEKIYRLIKTRICI